jgi:hypothetical protein
MGLKGYRLWAMGQLDSTCRSPPRLAATRRWRRRTPRAAAGRRPAAPRRSRPLPRRLACVALRRWWANTATPMCSATKVELASKRVETGFSLYRFKGRNQALLIYGPNCIQLVRSPTDGTALMKDSRCHGVALQVAFEMRTLKPDFPLDRL